MLLHTLREKTRRNPRYSLRAFAKELGISAPYLSQVLNRRRQLDEQRAAAIANRLPWKKDYKLLFAALVRLETLAEGTLRAQCLAEIGRLSSRMEKVAEVSLGQFLHISTWYHSAILELTFVRGFRPDTAWIAHRLGLSEDQARQALRDLVHVGLLDWKENRVVKPIPQSRIHSVPSRALRAYHLQMLERARRAIQSHEETSRKYGGVTMAIDPDRLEEAHRRMMEFRGELMSFLEGGDRRAVYHLSTMLFRLDKSDDHLTALPIGN